MNKVIKLIFTFLFLLNVCLSDRIIPDPDFPLLVKSPIRGVDNISTAFEFRFKLPIKTSSSSVNPASGIGFNQLIGVRFNDGIFSFSSIFPSCKLSSATTTYVVEAVQPSPSSLATTATTDTKVIYCRLVDSTNTRLPGDTTLTLTIIFGTKISNSWIHNISLFTSTSNNPDQLIIDNLPTFGSVGLYSDYTTSNNNKLIQISNGGGSSLATVTSPSNQATNTLYPGFTFDTRIVVQVMQYWIVDPEDFIIYVKYDTSLFLAPTGVATEDVSTNANEKKLSSTLLHVPQTDGFIITGFANGELYPNRKFKLVINGMRATDAKLEVATQIELLVYYKNTYSIVSYANINMDIVKMISLGATVNHPEYFYMYDGMAWPLLFTINSPVDISTGGFVVIRHKNKNVETNNLNFVASTCDFSSGTQAIDQGFGKMNLCRPLRNDFNHNTTSGLESTTNNEGSGIYFKLNQVTALVNYTVKVWAFIDKCIGDGSTLNIARNYAATLTFTVRIFKKAFINDTYINEESIFDLTKNYILARKTDVTLADGCFPLQTRSDYLTTDATTLDFATEIDGVFHKVPLNRIKWTSGTADVTPTPNYDYNLPIGIELHNISIIKPASTSDLIAAAKKSTLFFTYTDGKATASYPNSNLVTKYLYGSTASELSSTNLTFFALYQTDYAKWEETDTTLTEEALLKHSFQYYLPSECASINENIYITTSSTISTPRIQWLFSRDFLTPSSNSISNCQVSWLLVDNSNRTTSCANKTLFYGTGVSVGVNKNLTTITSAAITVTSGTTSIQKNMSESSSQIKSTFTNPTDITFRITSDPIIESGVRSLSMTGLNCFDKIRPPNQASGFEDNNDATFYNSGTIGVYTNCLNWKASTAVTSMFAYFEVQQVLVHNLVYPARVWRFIKLFPEPGFVQDPTDLDTTPTGDKILGTNEKWIIGHYEATTASAAPFSVCLIEISARIINEYKTTSSNTLVIWLFATSLLDTDVNDSTGQYPVAPVSDTAYGLNSGQTISLGNRRISDTQNWNGIVDKTIYPDLTAGEMGELEMTFYKQIIGARYPQQNIGEVIGNDDTDFPLVGFKSRRTMYQFFLGSIIYIPTSSDNVTGSDSTNMYIPFLCPSYADSSPYTTPFDYPSNGIYFVAPIVTVAWANMSAYNNITKIESYINPGVASATPLTGAGGTAFQLFSNTLLNTKTWATVFDKADAVANTVMPVQTPLYISADGIGAVAFNAANPKTKSAIASRSQSFADAYFKVSFNPYNNSSDKQLTLKLASSSVGEERRVSAISIFLNEDIGTLNSTVTGEFPITSNSDNAFKVKSLNSKVYVMGKPFNRFLAYAIVQNAGFMQNFPKTAYSGFTISTSIIVNGIPRLDISKYNSTGKINPFNYIAVFSSSSIVPTYGEALTNLRVYDTSKLAVFLLWHPDISYNEWYAVLNLDFPEDTIKDDKGGNIKLVGSLPSNIPIGSELTVTLSSNVLSSSISLCGLIENGLANTVTNCTISGSDLTCKFSKLTKNFEICCYNIINNNTQISATQGYVTLPYDTTIMTTNILSYTSEVFDKVWYKYPESTSGTAKLSNEYNFSGRVLPDITVSGSSFHAKLNNIIYSYTSTNGGFGKALFEVLLPRSLVRGMTLHIKIDLTTMNIPNFKPKIIATFGNSDLYGSSLETGDLFLDSVYSNLDTNGIKLKTKNILYKCGLELSRNLNIFIWPVQTVNLTKAAVTIEMKGADSNNLAAAFAHDVTSTPQNLQTTLVDSGITSDFMSISSITPRIVDEYTEYTFTFNFSSFATNLENKTVNELFIFFPHEYYEHNELLCYNGTSRLTCNFLETGMLSIRLGSSLTITSDTRLAIRLIGVINPYLGTNNGVYFACSVNNANFRTGQRTTLIRGTATINEGTLPSNNDVTYGNLVFKNEFNKMGFTTLAVSDLSQGQPTDSEEPLNPREDRSLVNASSVSLHQFGLTFDIANNFITGWDNGYTMQTPNLYITFPKQFRFEQRTFTPTVRIEAYFMDQTDNTLITMTENFATTNSVTVVGNQLRLTFTQTSWSFSKYFQYFIVKVYGVHPPSDNIIDGLSTTEGIRFTLFNNERTVIHRTWPNLFNFSKYDIGSSKISDLLPQNKGFKYEYDNKRWIIDVVDKIRNKINEIILVAGRYNNYSLAVRSNSKFITPANAEIGLETGIVEFEKNYQISTASFNDVAIRVGVACNVDLGDVIILPRIVSANVSSIYNTFLPLAPVKASIVFHRSMSNIISVPKVVNVRRGGSTFITYTLAFYTFSDLAITFETNSNNESMIEPVTIKKGRLSARTTFRMLDANTEFTQSFLTGNVNDCTRFENPRLSFRVNADVAIIPNNALLPNNFVYYNSSTDNTLLGNQIRFVMTTIYTEIYVYAALTCLDKEFPTDLELRTQNVTTSNTLAYYSDIITNVNDDKSNTANIQNSHNLDFSNLVRGQRFKLKVIIESTQANSTLRTFSTIVLTNYTAANGTIDYFIATKSVTPICTSYRFVTRPGIQVTNPLLFYWQSKFSSAGYYETGCITAVDQYGTSASGLPSIVNETNCGTANCRFIDRNNYVVNQTSLNVSETYTICAYPLSYCDTDPSNYEEIYTDILNTLPTNTSFPAVLNTLVVPAFTVTRISDGSAPSTPTVSNVKVTGSRMTFDAKSGSSITCFVRSAAPSKTYTAADFESCSTGCLVVDLTTESESFSVNVDVSGVNNSNNSTAACSETSTNFKLYGVCFNSAPCSNLKTNVLDLGTGILSSKTGNCTSDQNGNNTNTPSTFVTMNMMIFFILALILLA